MVFRPLTVLLMLLVPAATLATDPPRKPLAVRRSSTATNPPGGAGQLPQGREGDRGAADKARKEARAAAESNLRGSAGGQSTPADQSRKTNGATSGTGQPPRTGLPTDP